MIKNQNKNNIELTNVGSSGAIIIHNQGVEESSVIDDSEGTMPRESCDETNSYYNGSKKAISSAEPTPDQPKIKKSPVKKKKIVHSPSKNFVKKGYLSSDNQSTGSVRMRKSIKPDYLSPVKRNSGTKLKKKNPHVQKRTVNLKINKSKETIGKVNTFDVPKMRPSPSNRAYL